MADYDLAVRGGLVIDGTGAPPVSADVAIKDGRIASIGKLSGTAEKVLDAGGAVVTPGFVDGHTHLDAQVFWDELGSPSCWHGVTTVAMGNCGFTLAPVHDDARNLVIANLERAEDIPRESMEEGIVWTWSSFGQYLDAVEALPKAINYAAYVGHSSLRTFAMGERAFEPLAPTEAELATMERELREAMRAGAIGLSSSRSIHETADDRPVASRMATWKELSRLVSVMGSTGSGIFELANESVAGSPDPDEREEYFGRLRRLAIESGVPVTFGLQPAGRGLRLLHTADQAAEQGGRIFGQSHSRGISLVTSFRTHTAFERLPEWREVLARPHEEILSSFRDPGTRTRLIQAAKFGDYGRAIGPEPSKPDFERLRLYDDPLPPHRSVGEIARARRADPMEVIIDLALETDLDQLFIEPLVPDTEDEILEVMRHPRATMTFSDTGAHVSQIVDCSIQTYLLAYWVRMRNAFTLEQAVHMITEVPARAWGFVDRGVLRPGLVADLNIFDPDTIGPDATVVAADLPGGAKRLVQRAKGIRATVVAGRPTFVEGRSTGQLPGRLLRGPFKVAVPGASSSDTAEG